MRVYTRVVYEWQGDELVQTEAESYEYEGPVDLCKGGGSPKNYANLERLYGIQADQAEFLGETFKGTIAPAYKKWLGEAQDYGSLANQELAAERAGKASSGAISAQQQALEGNLASLGINPADARYAQGMREMGIQGAAQQAAAETTAREGIRDKGFARQQDAIGMGMGTPTQASQAANSAANAATGSLTAQNQYQQNQQNNAANMMRAGTSVWNAYNDYDKGNSGGGWADGGQVKKNGILRLKQGGYVQRLAQGGFAGQGTGGKGFMAGPQIQAPPPMQPPPPPSAAQQGVGAASKTIGMRGIQTGAGKAIETGGRAFGSPGTEAFGRGLQMSPSQASAEAARYEQSRIHAQAAVDKAMGPMGPPTEEAMALEQAAAATPAAELGTEAIMAGAGQAVAADTAAMAAPVALETAGAASAGLTGAAALGTAVPVLGAGLALYGIGNAAGWWADGGEVTPGSNGQTGEVDGPGGPKDDEVLAALSDGEFVMPKGVVNFYGIKHLENMRKKGLEYEKQMGIA